MNSNKPIPVLTEVIGEPREPLPVSAFDPVRAEALAQALEAQLQPLIKDAIRNAVKDRAEGHPAGGDRAAHGARPAYARRFGARSDGA